MWLAAVALPFLAIWLGVLLVGVPLLVLTLMCCGLRKLWGSAPRPRGVRCSHVRRTH